MRLTFLLGLIACVPGTQLVPRAPSSFVLAPDTSLASRIDSAIAALLPARRIPGVAVAVLRHDTLVHSSGYGVVGIHGGAPVTTATIFQIASTTKPLTAMAVLMLVEEGRVQLDAPAARYLAWLPSKYAGVTVRQLLTHTSGVSPDMRTENIDEFDVAEFKRRLNERPVSFAPGTRVQYANTGFTLLAFIAEAVSGEEFGRFVARRIFAPLGMTGAGYRVPQQADQNHARGYELVNGELVEAPHVFSGWGNSGIEAGVLDLAKFAVALDRRALMRPETYDLMYTPARLANDSVPSFNSNGVPTQFGLSWFLSSYRGRQTISHGGAVAGFSSVLDQYVQDGWTIIVLSNGKQGADRASQASAIARAVADIIFDAAAAGTARAVRAEIEGRNRAMESAFNRGDLAAVARFYTDDAQIIGRDGSVDAAGRHGLDQYWRGIRGGKSWRLDVLSVGGPRDSPYQVGRSTLVFDPGSGERTAVTHFLVLWRREPSGELRIALDYYH